jgi:hypothetical protein
MVARYLEKYGESVLENGYDICFIRPGEKRPFGKEWEDKKHGPNLLARFVESGKGNFGVGIKSRKTPLVDIDCYDADLVEHMRKYTEELVGPALERTGLAPKLGMVYRASKAFPKTQSKTFIDDEGRAVKLEVLGDGQQFVALHIHPDTGKPYRWKDKRHVGNTPRSELEEITQEDATELVAEFERQCRERGWVEKKGAASALAKRKAGDLDLDDPFITDKQKVDLSTDDLRAKLQMVPDPESYDQWFFVGMALYHQFDGSDEGLALWHEWSAEADNYDSDALDEKWSTFDVEGKKREPLTARYILKAAIAEEKRVSVEESEEVREALEEAADIPAIQDICARIKRTAFDSIMRATLVTEIRKKIKALSGTSMSAAAVAAMVRYENPENRSTPPWLTNFVYIQKDETFYNTKTRQKLTVKAFDHSFGRWMMTKKDRLEGRSSPEHTASHVALYRYQIATVANAMYLPMYDDEVVTINGLDYVNSYSSDTIPDCPPKLSKRGKLFVDRILAHLEHLFADEKDRKLLLSWLAYVVQTNSRANWSPVIQGVQGDGKTFFYEMMGVVLGGANVRTINGDQLAEKYTPWAENVQFCFVEEVRLHGKDRFAIINKMKPYVTNKMVPVRRMNVDTYDVLNTVAYMLTTNHKDGVPVDENDTRYFPMFSRWQTKRSLDKFNAANPHYYADLMECLEEPGQLRRWLLDYELDPLFNPKRRAPVSASKAEMVYLNQTDEEEALGMALEESADPEFSHALLDSAKLSDALIEHGGIGLAGRAVKMLLSEAGFTFLGIVKLEGTTRRLWSQEPERFKLNDGKPNTAAIRKYVAEGGDAI